MRVSIILYSRYTISLDTDSPKSKMTVERSQVQQRKSLLFAFSVVGVKGNWCTTMRLIEVCHSYFFFWLNFFLKFNTFDVKIRENSLGKKEKKWSYEKSDFSFAVTTFDTTFPSMRAIISHFARFSPILYLLKNRYRPSGTLFHFRRWVH